MPYLHRAALLAGFFVFLHSFVHSQPATLADTIVFNAAIDIQSIGNKIFLLDDRSGKLTIKDVLSKDYQSQFRRSINEIPNFGNTQSAIWCKFTVKNASDEACILEVKKSLIHRIDFFIPTSADSFNIITTGALFPLNTRPIRDNYFLFELLPPHSTARTFYMRFKSEESLEIPLTLTTPEALFYEHKAEEVLFGIFYGLMAVMFIYNLFIYFTVKEKAYLQYVLFLLAITFLNDVMISGLGFEYVWPNIPQVNFLVNGLTALVCVFIVSFSRAFLDTKVNAPLLHKVLTGYYAFSFLLIALNISGEYFFTSIGSQIETISLTFLLTITAVFTWRKGVLIARFYLLAWGFLFLSAVLFVLFMNGILPPSKLIENAPMLGTMLQVVFFSFALADRINYFRHEKEKAQLEKIQLMQEQNTMLEKMVAQRTYEILTQNEEIASQNEALISHQDQIHKQNEELQHHNIRLEKAQEVIEAQNLDLKKYSEDLEHEIEKRAEDLLKSNKELVEQNQQLEQFAFIASHNLRAPVARIQGLANIIDSTLHQPDEHEKKFILKKIVESSRELDSVIYDLSRILEIRKNSKQGYALVNIEEKIFRVLSMLQDEIKEADMKISLNLKAREFITIPQYFESIIYNLISNAIKYRKSEITPEITIDVYVQDNHLHLDVKDNGIGFDAGMFKEKVFGLYQRFHTHVEGKGIGLHLVKTQVDTLDGFIDVASMPDEGATFNIKFPYNK
jgi:signal transduction histidine kinase